MDEALDRWCLRWLGSGVAEVLFEAGSLSRVVGIRLADDRAVVVKVRRSHPRLAAADAVHRHVWRSGYPAPEPLVPPTPYTATESATAERLVRGGAPRRDAARSAQALAALIAVTASAGDVGSLAPSPPWVARDEPVPGADRCRERLQRYEAPRVIGHADWHADNVRWSGDRLLVVHDWDSVVSEPEAVIAGIAAAIFPATGDTWQTATVEESAAFLSAYVRAGARDWTRDDTEAFWAASAWTLAADGAVSDLPERLSLAGA